MAEEFQESEVMYEEDDSEYDVDSDSTSNFRESKINKAKRRRQRTNSAAAKSVPVNIPENAKRNAWLRFADSDSEGDDGELVPPHLIVGRRAAGKMMAFSVCTGNGRTLKGRDLSEVRNSILRLTGFLET